MHEVNLPGSWAGGRWWLALPDVAKGALSTIFEIRPWRQLRNRSVDPDYNIYAYPDPSAFLTLPAEPAMADPDTTDPVGAPPDPPLSVAIGMLSDLARDLCALVVSKGRPSGCAGWGMSAHPPVPERNDPLNRSLTHVLPLPKRLLPSPM